MEINAVTTDTEETVGSVIKQAEELRDMLLRFEFLIAQCAGESEDFLNATELLKVPLCRLTKTMVPNVQRKIDEIVTAQKLNLVVCESERGADMKDNNGNSFELKVSICRKTDNYKSNFIWPIPTGENNKEKLLRQVAVKTEGPGGGAYFTAKNQRGEVLNEYFISGKLLYSFFEYLPLKKRKNYNFGSERCNACESYHRLDRFKEWDKKGMVVTSSECELYNSVKSQCK